MFTKTRKTIKDVVDAKDLNGALMSVEQGRTSATVSLVVGAEFENRQRSAFTKESLGELIVNLQDLHDAME